ncbi:hypothetical protein [Clostridium cellulovorans]|uniref:Uncharacterized protein n=1 Tax=Clostridium cellulovorans (strain ATCC 35296 / DSM 3052 / OCM 3 / 743B) TaxID=573061 RepID=D9SR90_CLOC7|nr:hypothetical protein [Clostridium cellulovorans]ADL50378.1 hypothetical protein Clocel_0607 [Clostridium cellulovorans 743B]
MQKNARGLVQDSCNNLNTARQSLQSAIDTAEKPQNRQDIQDALRVVDSALSKCQGIANSLSNQ